MNRFFRLPEPSEPKSPVKKVQKRTSDQISGNNDGPTENYFNPTAKDNAGGDAKKQKLTKAQRDLQKVDKKGMKSLSSYFMRPAKK